MRKRTLHLFAGAGGGILADLLLGHQPVCAVEIDPYCQQVLAARQKDGCLPWFPIFDDVRKFNGKPWRGLVDIVAGGFPCQDISIANPYGKGITGERSGLWSEMWRIIGEIQPKKVFVENSWRLVSRGLGGMLTEFAEGGYDARWITLGGHDTGSCTDGKRIWIYLAKTDSERRQKIQRVSALKFGSTSSSKRQFSRAIGATWDEETDTRMRGNPDEMGRGMERLKAIGNGQDPILAATAWRILSNAN